MKIENKTQTSILLGILIVIGALVIFYTRNTYYFPQKNVSVKVETPMPLTPPTMKGPTTPPPGYESTR